MKWFFGVGESNVFVFLSWDFLFMSKTTIFRLSREVRVDSNQMSIWSGLCYVNFLSAIIIWLFSQNITSCSQTVAKRSQTEEISPCMIELSKNCIQLYKKTFHLTVNKPSTLQTTFAIWMLACFFFWTFFVRKFFICTATRQLCCQSKISETLNRALKWIP